MQSTWVVKMAAKKSSLHWLPLEMLRSQTEIVQNMMEASGMTQRIKHRETCRGSFCQSTNCIKLVCSCAIQVQNRVPTSAFSSGYVVCACLCGKELGSIFRERLAVAWLHTRLQGAELKKRVHTIQATCNIVTCTNNEPF